MWESYGFKEIVSVIQQLIINNAIPKPLSNAREERPCSICDVSLNSGLMVGIQPCSLNKRVLQINVILDKLEHDLDQLLLVVFV